jgi:hypothetical protein
MKKPARNQPFYNNRNWQTGFVVSLVAVLVIYALVARPKTDRDVTEPVQEVPIQTVQVSSLPATALPETGWKEGLSFTAPGSLPSDLLRVGEEVWIFSDEGKTLARVSLMGELLSETALEATCGKAAWDGEAIWCVNMDAVVSKVDPQTGKLLEQFETEVERIQSVAWDGGSLWLMEQRGSIASYDRAGKQLESSRVGSYGFARDLAWKGNEVGVVYIPPQLALYDANFKLVERTNSACGLSQGVLDYSIDWDGESLWFLDFISGKVQQCLPLD